MTEENRDMATKVSRFINWKQYRLTSKNMKVAGKRFISIVGLDNIMTDELKAEEITDAEAIETLYGLTGDVDEEVQRKLKLVKDAFTKGWAKQKDSLSKITEEMYSEFMELIGFVDIITKVIYNSEINNITNGKTMLNTEGITIHLDFMNSQISLKGKLQYEILTELKPVTTIGSGRGIHPVFSSAGQDIKYRDIGGKRMSPSGQIEVSDSDKFKGMVDRGRFNFLTEFISNFTKINRMVR